MQKNVLFEHLERTNNICFTLKGKVCWISRLLPAEHFPCQAFLVGLFPPADEGIQEQEKPLEKAELSSSPGKGEDKEVKPGEA